MARRPKGQETRERILTTALREFATRGYQAVTIEEIADAAGVTKGAVYHWFADKEDLGRELQHELYERLTTIALGALDPRADAVTNMGRAFEVFADAVGDLGEARFFLRDAWTIPALDEAGRRDHEDAIAMVRGLLSGAIERGEIAPLDPDALARVLMGAWAEATLHMLASPDPAGTVTVVEHLLESLRVTPRRRRPATAGAKPAHAAPAVRRARPSKGRRRGR